MADRNLAAVGKTRLQRRLRLHFRKEAAGDPGFFQTGLDHGRHAELGQHARQRFGPLGPGNAHHLRRRPRRVGQRPQDVEDRAHAQFLADRRDVLHRRMVVGREHETDAGLLDAAGDLLGLEVDVGTQAFQHIGAAALAADAAAAMLADLGASRGSHEHAAGGNVERVRSVTPRADDVDQMRLVADMNGRGELAHDLGRSGNFAHGLFLDTQSHHERGNHDGRHLATHDATHERQHLVVEDFAVLDDALQGLLIGDLAHDGNLTSSGSWPAWRGRAR